MITKLLTILLEWLYSFGEGIMNLASKLLLTLNSSGGSEPATFESLLATHSPTARFPLVDTSGTTMVEALNSWNGSYSTSIPVLNTTAAPAGLTGNAPQWTTTGGYGSMHSANLASAFSGTGGTIMFGVKGNGAGWLNNTSNHFWTRVEADANNFIVIQHTTTANQLRFRYRANGNNFDQTPTLGAEPTDWIHVALTYSDSAGDGEIRAYINGALLGTTAVTQAWGGSGLSSTDVVIGATATDVAPQSPNASFIEFDFIPTPLATDDILALYNLWAGI